MSEGGAYKTRRTKRPGLFSPAARTSKSFRPAQPKQIIPTSLLVVETRLELLDISRIIVVHGLKSGRGYYILWLLASSKYPICAEFGIYLTPVTPTSCGFRNPGLRNTSPRICREPVRLQQPVREAGRTACPGCAICAG